MKRKIFYLPIILLVCSLSLFGQGFPTEPFEIDHILVAACSINNPTNTEGLNEMVSFQLGPASFNMNNLNVKWATTTISWHGIVEDGYTALKTDSLNNTITNGCGWILEPPAGVVPAYRKVMLCSSYLVQVNVNSFANLQDTIYIIYAKDSTHLGHFANYSTTPPTIRSFKMWINIPSFYQDSVAYDRALLSHVKGAAVVYDTLGNATYVNIGCNAPFNPPLASIHISSNHSDTICTGTALTFSSSIVNGGTLPLYQWQLNGVNINGETSSTYSTSSLVNNDSIRCILTSNKVCIAGNPATSNSIGITIDIPPATASGNAPCLGQTLMLTSGGGTIFNWVGPNGFSSSTQDPSISGMTPSEAGTYTVTITDANGCSSTAQTTISISPNPTATASSNAPCTGQTLDLSAGGGSTYNWTGPNSFSSSTQDPSISGVTPSEVGTYTVTVTDANGCSSTAQTTVNLGPNPTATASSNTPCEGQTLDLSAGGGLTYNWAGPNSFSSSTQDPAISGVTPSEVGTYTVTVTDANGCSATAQTTVSLGPNPTATASSNTPCAGQTLNLSAGGGTNYNWAGPNSFSSSSQNPSISGATLSDAGTYTVTVTNANGCSATAQTLVLLNPSPTATTSSNTPCQGETLNLSGGGGATYNWAGPNGFSSSSQNPSINSVTSSAAGIYTVTITDAQGCSGTGNISVSINALPSVSLNGIGNLCVNSNPVTLSGTPTGGAFSGTGVVGNTFDPSQAGIGGPYALVYSYTDANTCTNSDTINVSVNAVPSLNLQSDPSSQIYPGEVVAITAVPGGYLNYNFYVKSSLVQSGTSNNYQSVTFQNGDTVMVIAIENGCITSESLILDIKPFPNAFTPNGNGKNDVFLKGLDLQIINRWGQLLYSGKDGWDGTYNGHKVSAGTYYYIVTLTDLDQSKKILKGSVTIVDPH